jgi:hypothetical protein
MVSGFYVWLLGLSLFPLAALLLYGLFAALARNPPVARSLPPHETTAAIALVALPVFGAALGIYVVGGYTHRYAVPAVIGCSILLAAALDRLGRGRLVVTGALGAVLLGGFALHAVREESETPQAVAVQGEVNDLLAGPGASDRLPVVVSDVTAFLVWAHYAPPPLAARLTWVTNDAAHLAARRALRPVAPLNLEDYATFAAAHKRFLVLRGSDTAPEWLLADLENRGARVEIQGRGKYVTVLLVDCTCAVSQPP